jgi:hypothetical protein
MGYNPYICIVCGDIEDNGWMHTHKDWISCESRVFIIKRRLGKQACPYYHEEGCYKSPYHGVVTDDVCDRCFEKEEESSSDEDSE